MTNGFSYVHEALTWFSPDYGLDPATASSLLSDQLKDASWRRGFARELASMLRSESVDWMSVVDNATFSMGDFETADEAREYVAELLLPFVPEAM